MKDLRLTNRWLNNNHACPAAKAWFKAQPDTSLTTLWDTCPNGAWMLWMAKRLEVDNQQLLPVIMQIFKQQLSKTTIALAEYGIACNLDTLDCTTSEDLGIIADTAEKLYDSLCEQIANEELQVSISIPNKLVYSCYITACNLRLGPTLTYLHTAVHVMCDLDHTVELSLANSLRKSVNLDILLASSKTALVYGGLENALQH